MRKRTGWTTKRKQKRAAFGFPTGIVLKECQYLQQRLVIRCLFPPYLSISSVVGFILEGIGAAHISLMNLMKSSRCQTQVLIKAQLNRTLRMSAFLFKLRLWDLDAKSSIKSGSVWRV